MHEKICKPCCKGAYCKQESCQLRKCKCKQTSNKTVNGPCDYGTTKGFVQNLKEKIVRLQNDSLQLQFGKRPLKKKQKDYYCLMLRKINNLDKKLANLENLFISHLNHKSTEMFRSNDNEPYYNYLDFYESVRSMVELANKLKQDVLHRKCDNHTTNISDRIHVLDSELRNLYLYLDQLQSVSNEMQEPKQYFVNEHFCCNQNSYAVIPQMEITNDLSEFRKQTQNNRSTNKHSNVKPKNYSYPYPSSPHSEYYGAKDKNSVIDLVSCQCSKCNIYSQLHYSPERYDYNHTQPLSQNSVCSCKICKVERKPNQKDTNVYFSRRISSCSCELCVNKRQKTNINHNKPCNTKIKLIKQSNNNRAEVLTTISQGNEENSLCDELHISYHDIPPNKRNRKKKRKNKKNVNVSGNIEYKIEESPYSSLERPASKTVSIVKSEEIIVMEENREITRNGNGSSSKKQNHKDDRLVYYEPTPEVNLITKKRTSKKIYYNDELESSKIVDENSNRHSQRDYMNGKRYFVIEQPPPDKKIVKIMKNKKYLNGDVMNNSSSSSSDNLAREQKNKYLRVKSNKYVAAENNNSSKGKHVHITFHKKKDCGSIEEERLVRPRHQHNCWNGLSQCYHKKREHFCNFHNTRHNEKISPGFHSHRHDLNNLDSSDSAESDQSSSQRRVFFCGDPNCLEKLDSDELIMLLNNDDLASRWESPHNLDIKESVRDFKSDLCDRCTIKEKTISVMPHKPRHKNNKNKEKIIIKKEIIECSNCKSKRTNEQIGFKENKVKVKENGEERHKKTNNNQKNNNPIHNQEEDTRKDSEEIMKSNISNTFKTQSYKENNHNPPQESGQQEHSKPLPNSSFVSSGHSKNYNNSEGKNENRKELNNDRVKESESYKNNNNRSDNPSVQISDNNSTGQRKKNANIIVGRAAVDQKCKFKTVKVNDNDPSQAIELPLPVPGFGNTININIERGSSLPVQYVSDQLVDQNNKSEAVQCIPNVNLGAKEHSGGEGDNVFRKNIIDKECKAGNNRETSNKVNRSPPLNAEIMQDFKQILVQRAKENISRNKTNWGHSPVLNTFGKKSNSVLELTKIRDRGKSELMAVKSDVLNVLVGKEANNKVEMWNIPKNNYNKFDNVLAYPAMITQDMTGKDGKEMQKQKEKVDTKIEKSLDHNTLQRSTEILMENENFSYSFESDQKLPSLNKLRTSKQTKKKHYEPRLSVTGLRTYGKRSRLKYNKNFGLSLSRVSSINSVIVQHAKMYENNGFPLKNIRKDKRIKKTKHEIEPEINVRCGKNPQIDITVDEDFMNEFNITTNDSSNFRYKMASVSNYLSSSVTSESSYSTLNWEKVANKLKDNCY